LSWLILAIPIAVIARLSQPIPETWVNAPFWLRPLVAGDALAFYLCKLLYPLTLVPDYNRSPSVIRGNYEVFYTWLVPAILAATLLRFCWRHRARAPLVAGAVWFVVGLLPVLGLTPFAFQHMSTVADRYVYLPMFGVALGAAWVLDRASHLRLPLQRGLIGISMVVLIALGVRTFYQTQYWRNTFTLFDHSIQTIGRTPGAVEGAPW
jgi:hypothetical protein